VLSFKGFKQMYRRLGAVTSTGMARMGGLKTNLNPMIEEGPYHLLVCLPDRCRREISLKHVSFEMFTTGLISSSWHMAPLAVIVEVSSVLSPKLCANVKIPTQELVEKQVKEHK
jgi:hypothetical protein